MLFRYDAKVNLAPRHDSYALLEVFGERLVVQKDPGVLEACSGDSVTDVERQSHPIFSIESRLDLPHRLPNATQLIIPHQRDQSRFRPLMGIHGRWEEILRVFQTVILVDVESVFD